MIEVEVRAPRRCQGKYSFDGYREFYQWMAASFKGSVKASALLGLAERGHFSASTARFCIGCSCDKPLGYPAKELARETGHLKARIGGDTGYNLQRVHDYIGRLDQLSSQLEGIVTKLNRVAREELHF